MCEARGGGEGLPRMAGSPVSITRRPKWDSMMTVFRFSNSFSRTTP